MRDSAGIRLEEAIVHIIDPRGVGLVLSERPIPLDGDRLADYFISHIRQSLVDSQAKAGRFRDPTQGLAAVTCISLMNRSLTLVDGSRRLAERLSSIMSGDDRISPGDLAVCLYQAANYPHVQRFVALLKIDPSDVFRHKTYRDREDKLIVTFEIESDVMPTTREKLQKCAFVQPLEPRPPYDMMLIDRQVAAPPAPRIARFFVEQFLEAEFALDARQRTDRLYRGLASGQNRIRAELSSEENRRLEIARDLAIRAPQINLDNLIASLPVSTDHQQEINQVVSELLPDREFENDTQYAEKLLKKRRFRGSHGLKVEVEAEAYTHVVRDVRPIARDGGPRYFEITLQTEKWEEVPG